VLARFISQMLSGQTPTVFGDGTTSRDFTYIDNVVSANLLAAKAPAARVSGKVFNVATGRSVTLIEAYEEIRRITGYTGTLNFGPEREGDIKHSSADISRAKQAFDFNVAADLSYGLEKTIAWCRETAVTPA
jgi:UDP-glucose 4-epimerase